MLHVATILYRYVCLPAYRCCHRTDSAYVLENGSYGKPAMQELVNTSSSVILPAVMVDWTLTQQISP
ncbi:MAG: hypothetical protein IPH35_00260 [Rhodoferax sp.]|nr:hypothetical protein [Rhodoferax sp.]